MAVGIQSHQTFRENSDTTGQPDATLTEFGACAVAMRKALYQDRPLTETEFRFMENHFKVLEMAYLRWKRKHDSTGH